MITIEKPGSLPKKVEKEYRCKCSTCGCQFKATEEDVREHFNAREQDRPSYWADCPTKGCDESCEAIRIKSPRT